MEIFTHNLHRSQLLISSFHHVHCSAHIISPSVDVSRAASSLKKQGIEPTPKILYHLKKKEVWKARRRERKEKEKTARVTDPVWYEWPEEDGLAERGKLVAAQVEEDCVDDFLYFVREQNPEKRVVLNGGDECVDVDVGGFMKKKGLRVKKRECVKEKATINEKDVQFNSNQTSGNDRHLHDFLEIETNDENDKFDIERVIRIMNSKGVNRKFGIKRNPLQGTLSEDNVRILDLKHPYDGSSNMLRSCEIREASNLSGNLVNDGKIAKSTSVKYNAIHINEGKRAEHTENAGLDLSIDKTISTWGSMKHNPSSIHNNERAKCEDNDDSNLTLAINAELISTSGNIQYSPIHMHENKRHDQSLIDEFSEGTDEVASFVNVREEFSNQTKGTSPRHLDDDISTEKVFPLTSDSLVDISAMLSQPEALFFKSSTKNTKETYMFQVSKETPIEKFLDDEITQVPKMPEVWKKGVGIVKVKKLLFSKEIKEKIIAQRKGDSSLFYDSAEEDEEGMEGECAPMFHFDGRAALLEDKRIQNLAERLNRINYWTSKVHFSKVMHSGKMKLTEDRVLRIVEILGEWGNWRRAMQVVQWVHKRQHYQFHKSKFVLTTLISVLGKAQRPIEALNVFSVMREAYSSYPDMPAYHAIAVILGQAGYLKELLELIESLKMGPPKPIKFIPVLNWESYLQPDVIVYNAVLNACIPNKEWTGVSWTWDQMEMQRIRPNSATFGLTIEAMVKAGNFDQAIRYYKRMERAGFPANAQTYKCLVETFGKARKTDEAIELVKVMERSGTVGTASVYFVLACSLCLVGRLKEALLQVRKMQAIPSRKSDVITFTGLIQTCGAVGHIEDAAFLFKHMQLICAPNVRTCNEMIKIYGRNHLFEEAKMIYEGVKKGSFESCIFFDKTNRLHCDSFTFELMLKAAAISQQWAYFHRVYKNMTSQGFFLSGKTSLWVMMKVAKLKQVHVVDDMIHQLQKAGEVPDRCLYEAQILACVQSQCFQMASRYLDDMVKDGHEVASTIEAVRKQVHVAVWDNFLIAGSWGVVLS